jgi:hypothetical protein
MEVLGDALVAMREAPDPRVLVEVSLVRLCRPDVDTSPGAIVDRLERLERTLAAGGPAPPSTSASPVTPPAMSAAPPPPPATPSSVPPAPPSPTAPPPSASPTSGARLALAARAAPPSPSAPLPPPPRSQPPPSSHRPAPSPPSVPTAATGPAPRASDTGTPADSGAPFPTRDELTLAWGDTVLAALPRRAAVRYQVGRFTAAENEVATFALPNPVHRDRCEEVRADVEQALATYFKRPIPLRIVVDAGSAPPPTSTAPATGANPTAASGEQAASQPEPDHDVDIDDLRDAPPGTLASPVDHVMQAFEGAQVVED